MSKCKIKSVTAEYILFEDGTKISDLHYQEYDEHNFADFKKLDAAAREYVFDTDALVFKAVGRAGFKFGNQGNMFFIPCYSRQTGEYSTELIICKNGEFVLWFNCEWHSLSCNCGRCKRVGAYWSIGMR